MLKMMLLSALCATVYAGCTLSNARPGTPDAHHADCFDVTNRDIGENYKQGRNTKIETFYLKKFSGDFNSKSLAMFPKMNSLQITESNFPKISNDMFDNTEDIQYLRINSNRFTAIDADAFKSLNKLKVLELLNNEDLPSLDLIQLLSQNKEVFNLGLPTETLKSIDVASLKETLPKLRVVSYLKKDKDQMEEQIQKLEGQGINLLAKQCNEADCKF